MKHKKIFQALVIMILILSIPFSTAGWLNGHCEDCYYPDHKHTFYLTMAKSKTDNLRVMQNHWTGTSVVYCCRRSGGLGGIIMAIVAVVAVVATGGVAGAGLSAYGVYGGIATVGYAIGSAVFPGGRSGSAPRISITTGAPVYEDIPTVSTPI
ncbi:hypothetical protein DRJ17_01960 [Candidatus Woesearchaeota archaeon]|nr:MAG: hypothetical protein DRJ17_01960 [Candidatus Woesearchaeota archaeon]